MEMYRGQVLAYDATNHKADVMLVGSMSGIVVGVPVAYQVAPEQMVADAACGVAFLGEGDAGLVICTFDEVPTPPLDLDAFGPTLDIHDLVRGGYGDDLMGNVLDSRWDLQTAGTGAGGFVHGHGGLYRRWANTNGSWAELYLQGGGAHYQLDADEGWVVIARMRAPEADRTNFYQWLGARGSAGGDRYITGGISGVVADNWSITCQDSGGVSRTDSGVAHSSAWHELALKVTAASVKLWVDAVLVATHTDNITNENLRPYLGFYVATNALRRTDLDFVRYIPG